MSDYAHGWRYGFSITFVASMMFGAFGDVYRGHASVRMGDPQGIWHYHADQVPFSLAWFGYAFWLFIGLMVYLLHPLLRQFDTYPHPEEPRFTREFTDGYRSYCLLGAMAPPALYALSFIWTDRSVCHGSVYLAWNLIPIIVVFFFEIRRLRVWYRKPVENVNADAQ